MAPRDPVKSARRVLEILERFEAEKRPLGVSEIAQVLGYPLSSTSMLLNTLARLGYLNLDPASRKFAPTMSVAMLGDWIAEAIGLNFAGLGGGLVLATVGAVILLAVYALLVRGR